MKISIYAAFQKIATQHKKRNNLKYKLSLFYLSIYKFLYIYYCLYKTSLIQQTYIYNSVSAHYLVAPHVVTKSNIQQSAQSRSMRSSVQRQYEFFNRSNSHLHHKTVSPIQLLLALYNIG